MTNDSLINERPCPCGSKQIFIACCGRYIHGNSKAPTAEALMRSRYSAFVLKDSEYLSASWHPSTRPESLDLQSDSTEWVGLTVERSQGGMDDLEGEVTFRARFTHEGQPGELVERSRFVREDGAWLYLDGVQLPDEGRQKVGRNSPCPCDSGKKYKRCCGS
ncbi:MAG: YchJ family metal-binding protein [Gammaproteobacteria bacterium]|nr:YchJ family metal-binding protein [Gammaproteobacteria bacterium]